MFTGFPTNTVILIVATMVASASAAWFMLSQALKRLSLAQSIQRRWRWSAAILLVAWLLSRLALAAYLPGEAGLAAQFQITFAFLGFGLLVGILPLLFSPVFRQLVRAVPETWPIGVHAVRLAGFLFLALMDMGLLPAEFALSAGYGDMFAGLLALGVVYLLAKRKPYARQLAIAWNLYGLTDFVGALVTGGLFIPPFAARLAGAGISLDYLNYVLVIPAFGIPLYASLHIYSLFQLASQRVGETTRSEGAPGGKPVLPGEQRSAHL